MFTLGSSPAVPRSSQRVFSKEKLPESWEENSETNREIREQLEKVGKSSRSAGARRLQRAPGPEVHPPRRRDGPLAGLLRQGPRRFLQLFSNFCYRRFSIFSICFRLFLPRFWEVFLEKLPFMSFYELRDLNLRIGEEKNVNFAKVTPLGVEYKVTYFPSPPAKDTLATFST